MKTTILFTASLLLTALAEPGPEISVPVKPYEQKGINLTPAYFVVSARPFKELDRSGSNLSWVWFGGKITNETSNPAIYELTIRSLTRKMMNSAAGHSKGPSNPATSR